MAIQGETLALGAPQTCHTCAVTVRPQVLSSAAGWYVGTRCDCGPYTRESGYYETARQAALALSTGAYGR